MAWKAAVGLALLAAGPAFAGAGAKAPAPRTNPGTVASLAPVAMTTPAGSVAMAASAEASQAALPGLEAMGTAGRKDKPEASTAAQEEKAARQFDGGSGSASHGRDLVLVASYYYGQPGGVTTYIDSWMNAYLSRNAARVDLIRFGTPGAGPSTLSRSVGRGERRDVFVTQPPKGTESKPQDCAASVSRGLDRVFRDASPALVILHNPLPEVVSVAADAARSQAVPSMLMFHMWYSNLTASSSVEAYAKLDLRATVSRYLAGFIPGGASVLGPVMDFAFWSPASGSARAALRRSHGLDDAVVLLAPHRILPGKGQKDALEALIRLRGRGRRYALVLAGNVNDEAYAGELKRMTVDNDLERDVVWLPALSPEALRGWYEASDLVLVPSHSEALGLVALEAQAMGRPVVGYREGGIPETLEDGVTGLLAEPRDPASLADAIGRAAEPETHAAFSAAARPVVLKQYDPDRIMSEHERAYANLIGTDRTR